MLAFLAENLATILIGLAILALVVLIVVKLNRDKKKGRVAADAVVKTVPTRAIVTISLEKKASFRIYPEEAFFCCL